ncbi:MAG: hypothetical protein ACRD3B_02940 [Candidatus Sulfotelmatobacter sp.]
MRLLVITPVLLAAMMPVRARAQDDPNEIPLGDVARSLRKTNQPAQPPVIDDDNLTKVMDDADSRRGFGSSSLRYLMGGESKGFQVAAPDVTCSLAFTANVKTLLAGQYSQMDMPADDVAKLQGPATIEGDALTVSIFNDTNWHVSEVAVALTVVKKKTDSAGDLEVDSALQEIRPEKKQDVTVIYRMRAPAPPWERAVFSAPLNFELGPGDEWHWAIVQAKGYPPQGEGSAATASKDTPAVAQPVAVSLPVPPSVPQQQDQPGLVQQDQQH